MSRRLKRIEADPNYQKLVSERKSFGWTLVVVTVVIYYGFILLVAFAPRFLGAVADRRRHDDRHPHRHRRSSSSRSCSPAIYVKRANSEYDDLTSAIVKAKTR